MKRLLMALAVVAALGWVGNSAYASDFDKSHGASVQLVRGGHGHGGWYGGRGHGNWHGGQGWHGSYYHSYPRYYHSYPRYNYYYSYPSYRYYYPSYGYGSYGYGSHGSFYYGGPRVGISFGW